MKRRHLLALAMATPRRNEAAEVVQCVAPAKAGGGFDTTCRLVQAMLATSANAPRIVYQPGGIGALTYSEVVRGQRADPRELIAFSSGTLLNIVQGRFGAWQPDRIKWIAAIALDHGVVAVHPSTPWQGLEDLLTTLRRNPASVTFGMGGTIGSQDWMKAALLARAAGISHKSLRVVAFEGGGDALRALEGRHVNVLCGDAAELSSHLDSLRSGLRLLAALSGTRLSGRLADVPTALEQGADVRWPILRGVYASADLANAERIAVAERLALAMRSPDHHARIRALGLSPLALTGESLEREIREQLENLRAEANRFGLIAKR